MAVDGHGMVWYGMAWYGTCLSTQRAIDMPARGVCLVTLSLSEAGPGRFGRQVSVTDIYHTVPYHTTAAAH